MHEEAIWEHLTAIWELQTPTWEHLIAILEHQVLKWELQTVMLEHQTAMLEHQMALLEHQIPTWELQIDIWVQLTNPEQCTTERRAASVLPSSSSTTGHSQITGELVHVFFGGFLKSIVCEFFKYFFCRFLLQRFTIFLNFYLTL